LKWSEYQLRTYLRELTELEYLLPLAGRQGQPFRYRLLWDGQGESGERFLPGLKSVEQLRQEARLVGPAHFDFVPSEPTSRPQTELRGDFRHFEGTSLGGSHEVEPASQADKSRGLRNGGSTSRRLAGEPVPVNGERSVAYE
jgi:hypothetical protein